MFENAIKIIDRIPLIIGELKELNNLSFIILRNAIVNLPNENKCLAENP
jgi:hypothetical protein